MWAALAEFAVSLFHTGGVVGQSSGLSRRVSPALFMNAPRYHTGGIAGLKPDEVPAILQKGERVLTKGQQIAAASANSNTGNAGTRVTVVQNITTPNPDSFRRSGDQMAVDGIRAFNRAVRRNG